MQSIKRSNMLSRGKCHQILFCFVTLFMCEITGVSSQITVAVLFNSAKPQNPSTATSSTTIKNSFEKIPSMLDIDENVNFVYKDLNSTFCDLGTFLEFMDGRSYEVVVLKLEDCKCERMLLSFLDILKNIKSVSSCERPLFTAKGTSAIIQKVRKERQLYLMVSADTHGVEFYQELSFELQRQKLKLYRTLWVGGKSGKENQLQEELEKVARSMDDNVTSGATFVSGFLYTNDFRSKSLVNLARRVLGKQFGKILWIFPIIYLDFSNMQSFYKNSQALAFRESNPGNEHCHYRSQICALRIVLEKTSDVLKSCWGNDLHRDNLTEYRSRNTTAKFEYSVQKVERGGQWFSVKNKECKISRHNCLTDVLQLTTDHYIGEISWKRIATWNGKTIQPSSSQEGSTSVIHGPNIQTVFRVPIVEYFPFIIKHELNRFNSKCPVNSLPCYEQRRTRDNDTVINYADKYCCSGWTVDTLIYLTEKLSYEFVLYFQAEKLYGVYDNKTGEWNGMIQDIISGKGDISVDLALLPDRCAVLDCSLGYLFDGINVIIKLEFSTTDSPDKDSFHALVGNFQIFLSPFHIDLLIVVLMIFNVFLFLIWATDKICLSYRNKRFGRKKEKFTLLESTSYVWATAFGRDVGDSKKPLTLSARYLSSWLAFLALIFVNVYVARLTAELVKQEPTKPFSSLQDPEILNKKVKLGVVKGTSMEAFFHNTRDPVLKQSFENNIKENLLPSLDEGVQAVKNGTLDGFIADTISLLTILNQDPNCSLALMGRDFSINAVGFMFRKDWLWAEEFKLQELTMNEDKRNEDWWKMKQSYPLCKVPSQEHPQMSAANMSGVFLVLIFAVAYCCFSLVMENIHSLLVYRYRNSNDGWSVAHNHGNNINATNLSPVGDLPRLLSSHMKKR